MKVLIVGGTGVLSTAVVKEAVLHGMEMTVINRGNRSGILPEGVELLKADINDVERIHFLLGDRTFDCVIDFICYTPAQIQHSLRLFGTRAKQYVLISTSCVYDTSYLGIKTEDSPKAQTGWDYGVNKWRCEETLCKYASDTGLNYTIIRPCVTYDDTRIPYGIAPRYGYHWTLVARILSGKPIIRWNRGINRCNMTRVEDFAGGVVGLIGNPRAVGEAFNVCGEECPSFNDVLDVLGQLTGREVRTFDIDSETYAALLPSRSGEILGGRSIDAIVSNDKLKAVVPQFRQTINLKEGIEKTYLAYKNSNFQKGIDWHFDAETDYIIRRVGGDRSHTGFVDYLGNASIKDRLRYLSVYEQDNLLVKVGKKIYKKI